MLENLRLSPPRLVFASGKLEGETVVPITEPQENWRETADILVQPLPAWSRGIIEIDVHVVRSAPSSGALCASLYAVDGDRVLANWRIPFADLRPGWLPLRVAAALDRSFRTLELRLCAVGFEPMRLSMASTGLFDEFAMKIRPGATGGSNCDAVPSRILALRIGGRYPGLSEMFQRAAARIHCRESWRSRYRITSWRGFTRREISQRVSVGSTRCLVAGCCFTRSTTE